MGSDNQYSIDYIRQHQRQFMLRVNRNLDPEMVEWIESKGNVQAYLKKLVRADIEKEKRRQKRLARQK